MVFRALEDVCSQDSRNVWVIVDEDNNLICRVLGDPEVAKNRAQVIAQALTENET